MCWLLGGGGRNHEMDMEHLFFPKRRDHLEGTPVFHGGLKSKFISLSWLFPGRNEKRVPIKTDQTASLLSLPLEKFPV